MYRELRTEVFRPHAERLRALDIMFGPVRLRSRGLCWMALFTSTQSHNGGGQVMKEFNKYVGLDVHKESIAVAVAPAGAGEVRYFGEIPNTPEAMAKLVKQLSPPGQVLSRTRAQARRDARGHRGRSGQDRGGHPARATRCAANPPSRCGWAA